MQLSQRIRCLIGQVAVEAQVRIPMNQAFELEEKLEPA
jgi:hypothetical protein